MKLINADRLLEDLKQYRYSKKSLELINQQPQIYAIPLVYIYGFPSDTTIRKVLDSWYEFEDKMEQAKNERNS